MPWDIPVGHLGLSPAVRPPGTSTAAGELNWETGSSPGAGCVSRQASVGASRESPKCLLHRRVMPKRINWPWKQLSSDEKAVQSGVHHNFQKQPDNVCDHG